MNGSEGNKLPQKRTGLHLEGRELLSLTGVEDVRGFDENTVILSTVQGDLSVRGQELHIERIDLEEGKLLMKGHIQELSYDEPSVSGGFWHRLFG